METLKSKAFLGLSTLIFSLNVYATDIDVAMYDEAYVGLPGNEITVERKVSAVNELAATTTLEIKEDCNG